MNAARPIYVPIASLEEELLKIPRKKLGTKLIHSVMYD